MRCQAVPEGLVGLWNSRHCICKLEPPMWDSPVIEITASADAITLRWVTALCQAPHQKLYAYDLAEECCPLPSHTAPRWSFAIWGHFSPYGMSLMFKQVNGTWITKLGAEDCEDGEASTPWLVCCWPWITRLLRGSGSPAVWPGGRWEGVTSPTSCFLPSFLFLPPNRHTVKEKKGKTDAYSWSVQFNGQKPDLSHVIKSS